MAFERIDLRLSNCNWDHSASKTVDVLRSGGVAVVPTETVYGLAVRLVDRQAVHKLIRLKGREAGHPFALAFPSIETISDVCPEMSPLAWRLARRCMPGPVSLVLDVPPESMFWKLPPDIQQSVSQDSSVCCRVPDHPLLLTVLGELNEPIILTSANKTGQGEISHVDKIIASLGSGIGIVLDEGSLSSPKPSTVVKITGKDYTILREGILKAETIKRLAALMILFVGKNNTRFSPMAEYLCEKVLAERLHCGIEELEQRGIVVLSAGITAKEGEPAKESIIDLLKEYGMDAQHHRSMILTKSHVQFADAIYAMSRTIRESILSQWHHVDSRLYVLRKDGGDMNDGCINNGNMDDSAKSMYREISRRVEEMIAIHIGDVL